MAGVIGTTAGAGLPRRALKNVCSVGLSAVVIAAGLGIVAPREIYVRQVAHLETTLAASVISTAGAVLPLAASTLGPSAAAKVTPTASATAADTATTVVKGLVLAGAATLLAPVWYLAFPVVIPVAAVLFAAFLKAFSFGNFTPGGAIFSVAMGVLIYAAGPPALAISGLAAAAQALRTALFPAAAAQPAAAARTKTVVGDVPSSEAPTSTARSARGIAGPRRQSVTAAATAVPSASADAVPASSGPSGASKKSTAHEKAGGSTKRTTGNSGRNR